MLQGHFPLYQQDLWVHSAVVRIMSALAHITDIKYKTNFISYSFRRQTIQKKKKSVRNDTVSKLYKKKNHIYSHDSVS